jgi:hypothetical protein
MGGTPESPAGKDKHMNYETMHATDLLKALAGRSFCAVAEELAHVEGAYDADIARARIQKALDKNFLALGGLEGDFYSITALGAEYIADFDAYLEDQYAQQRAECEAEFRSSWIAGGGRQEDAGLAWAMHKTAYMAGDIG